MSRGEKRKNEKGHDIFDRIGREKITRDQHMPYD
jgi:hypothetical protein